MFIFEAAFFCFWGRGEEERGCKRKGEDGRKEDTRGWEEKRKEDTRGRERKGKRGEERLSSQQPQPSFET